MVYMEQFVMKTGSMRMPLLSAHNLDFHDMVCCPLNKRIF